MSCQTRINEFDTHMSKHREAEDEMKECYDPAMMKWQTVKEELIAEEAKYLRVKENLVGFVMKERELSGWIRKAEDACEQMKDIGQDENSEEIFETFEVS